MPTSSAAEVGEHRGLRRRVQRRRGVIEQEQARPAHQCSRQGDPLALAATQADAALPHHRVDAVRRLGDEVIGAGQAQCLPQVRFRDLLPERQVVTDRAGEEERLLGDDCPRPRREPHDARYRRHEACDDLDERRLPRAGRTDDRHHPALLHRQVDVVDRRAQLPGEREAGSNRVARPVRRAPARSPPQDRARSARPAPRAHGAIPPASAASRTARSRSDAAGRRAA